ncbi:hypothetical protein CDL12_04595 [Handroanthus impetiginosus]|uniref:NLP1-9 GAF domain-containing protein n=1 Tax=Handroanthus impetiginosus TaxID=429701 RepID=A0A2G9HYU2_9LAMI|nr:hypothetical protein CDL12_04595 [Handroanthus impetiginosus]
MGDQHDFSLTSNLEGWDEQYSRKECEKFFNDSDNWSSNVHPEEWGWVFWTTAKDPEKPSSSEPYEGAIRDEFKRLLDDLVDSTVSSPSYLIQFWVPKVVGGKRYLTTSDQPFAVGWYLRKGLCWYRKHCTDYNYFVGDSEGEEEDNGPVGRVFRNGLPESSPDLRLYSNTEHPLRDYAARCGGRRYIALPLFDLLRNQCIGVLELLTSCERIDLREFETLDKGLKKTGFRSTHIGWPSMYKNPIFEQKPHASEFTEMLEMAIDAVPELHLAQVWIPCEQCAYATGSNLSCMTRADFRAAAKNNSMRGFSNACRFHNIQSQKGIAGIVLSSTDKSCFCRNLCDFSISEFPLAHHAQQARLSFYFAICLRSVQNSDYLCLVEFFFHPDRGEDAYPWSLLHLLVQIIEKKVPGFKVASGKKLGEEVVEEVGIRNNMLASCEMGFSQPNISLYIEQKKHHYPKEFTTVCAMAGFDKSYSFSDFSEYLKKPDLCSSTPSKGNSRYLFWTMVREELPEYGSNIRILLQDNKVRSSWEHGFEGLVQFWALKRVDNRSYLSTSDQPFAVTSLHQGLCWYRKQCMDHQYFVNEEAKEEELGPLGRVFRNRYSECSPDLRLYSAKEFPLRDNAARCGLRYYLALPIFDLLEEQCVGVLEYVGFSHANWEFELGRVKEALEVINLKSSHIKVERPFFSFKVNRFRTISDNLLYCLLVFHSYGIH